MGMTRRSVQRITDLLVEKELTEYATAPAHRARPGTQRPIRHTALDRLSEPSPG
jgi:hypothetical protein